MSTPVPVSFGQVGDAFTWTRAQLTGPLDPIPDIQNPVADGLDAGLDSMVKAALEATGMMEKLEKVTGHLAELTAAAQAWNDQAEAMRQVAAALRSSASSLPGEWEGAAAEAFGAHMGKVVEAIDATADDMAQIAQIISQAAAECQLAEQLIIEIIREAIETLIITLAAGVVVDILTLGLATAAEALIVEGEIAIFIARVGRVSTKLEQALQKLWDAVKEMRAAGRSWEKIKEARKAAKAVRKLGGAGNRWDSLKNVVKDPSLENLGEYATARALQAGFGTVKGGVKGGLGTAIGAGDLAGVLGDTVFSDKGVDTVTGALDGPPKNAPYRVPTTRVEEAFG
ncbi:WXG100 family type VII secretion target [Kitasatospora camelliae]|uniref:WXG100 family type VII secretion target n=1 Tax=Kitasatospora camelliae TaxID=3156397 RepID=A0AAU8K262_9ACTN